MKKHKALSFLIISFFVGVSSVLLVYTGMTSKFREGLATVAWYHWIIYLVIAFYVTLTLHELGHFIAFFVQKIKLRAIYLTVFVFYKTKKGWRFSIKPKLWVLFGGLVVPDLEKINDEKTYNDIANKFSKALMSAPIVTIVFLVLSILTFLMSYLFSDHAAWIGFITIFNLYVVLLSTLYIYTFKLSNQMFYGDFVAYRKMRTEEVFKYVQLNQYVSFGLEEKPYSVFLWEKSRELLKDNTLKRNIFDTMLVMSYLEGIIYEGMKPDLELEKKITALRPASYAKVEHGLMVLYDLVLYHYKLGNPKEAYDLIEKIEKYQGQNIKAELKVYLNKKAKHVTHLAYDQQYLNDKQNYPVEQSWIFEPIIDVYKDMETLHKPLEFIVYESKVDLEVLEDEAIKKSETSLE